MTSVNLKQIKSSFTLFITKYILSILRHTIVVIAKINDRNVFTTAFS